MDTRTRKFAAWFAGLIGTIGPVGCGTIRSPFPVDAFIRRPVPTPELPPPLPPPSELPQTPKDPPTLEVPSPPAVPPTTAKLVPLPSGTLGLGAILASVDQNFPLIYAVEQEYAITAGRRLSAEGQFDTVLRASGLNQTGTFANTRLDSSVEQPLPWNGATAFAGWRNGQGNFPIYYGDQITGDGGEFRAGIVLPLMQGRPIDPRRVAVRQAQIAEQLADPTVRRARLDYFRAAARTYWDWVSAGAHLQVASELLELAENRQGFIDEQRKQQLVAETVQVLNRRLIASRQETKIAAERALQHAAIRLSLYLRDKTGHPVVPTASQLPPQFTSAEPVEPELARLTADVSVAIAQRPELVDFHLRKESLSTDLALARNQVEPELNLIANANQDVGLSEKQFTGNGVFRTNRTVAQLGLTFELPAQRRVALGNVRAIQAELSQLLARERYARDQITAEVQDAVSELEQTYRRLQAVREEYQQAVKVRALETESFRGGRTSLVDLNLQEIAAAEAKARVVGVLAAYYRGVADYLATLGLDPSRPDPNSDQFRFCFPEWPAPTEQPESPNPETLPPPREQPTPKSD